jgi:hypothetical protein
MYIDMTLQENDPANNRSRVRVFAGISDASASLGGTGTASYSVTVSSVGELAFSTQPYNFTGNSGRDYRFFDNSSIWVPHTADGSQGVTAYLSVSFFNSFIPGNNISVSIGLTDYDISTGNIWNGTNFVKGFPYIWNGTTFARALPLVWNGTTWKGV